MTDADRTAPRCPRCGSPKPCLHPAMQFEGEVQPCPHPWHIDSDRAHADPQKSLVPAELGAE